MVKIILTYPFGNVKHTTDQNGDDWGMLSGQIESGDVVRNGHNDSCDWDSSGPVGISLGSIRISWDSSRLINLDWKISREIMIK